MSLRQKLWVSTVSRSMYDNETIIVGTTEEHALEGVKCTLFGWKNKGELPAIHEKPLAQFTEATAKRGITGAERLAALRALAEYFGSDPRPFPMPTALGYVVIPR